MTSRRALFAEALPNARKIPLVACPRTRHQRVSVFVTSVAMFPGAAARGEWFLQVLGGARLRGHSCPRLSSLRPPCSPARSANPYPAKAALRRSYRSAHSRARKEKTASPPTPLVMLTPIQARQAQLLVWPIATFLCPGVGDHAILGGDSTGLAFHHLAVTGWTYDGEPRAGWRVGGDPIIRCGSRHVLSDLTKPRPSKASKSAALPAEADRRRGG